MSAVAVEALEIWAAAEEPDIRQRPFIWPELSRLVAAAVALAESAANSTPIADARREAYRVRRALVHTPLPPQHPAVDLEALTTACDSAVAVASGSYDEAQLMELQIAVRALAGSSSPLSDWAEQELSLYGDDPEGRPEAAVIVPTAHLRVGVAVWLAEMELHADVMTINEARRSRPFRAALIAGDPGTAMSNQWITQDMAARHHEWLLRTPPAPVVHQAVLERTPREAPPRGTARPAPHTVDGRVSVGLASGHALHFHPRLGPKPLEVTVDENGVPALAPTTASSLDPSSILAVLDRSSRAILVAEADRWLLRQGWTAARIAVARAAVERIKNRLQATLRARTAGTVRDMLVAAGLEADYAAFLCEAPLREDYLAPGTDGAFRTLVDVIGAPDLTPMFPEVATVRVAHRRAWDAVKNQLVQRLTCGEALEPLDDDGYLSVELAAGGRVLVSRVVEILLPPLSVPDAGWGALTS